MVSVAQGDVWWAELGEPRGSEAGFRRPVVVVQGDAFNESRIATILCVPLTSNMRRRDVPGNVVLTARETGLSDDSVANVAQLLPVNRTDLDDRMGRISPRKLRLLFAGIDVVLGR